MGRPTNASGSHYTIEQAGDGYRVLGNGILVWEETWRGAVERREDLEWPGDVERGPKHAAGRGDGLPGSPICCPVSHPGFGRSLFVNVSPPGRQVCSFDCVFCTNPRPPPGRVSGWPTPGAIGSALANRPSSFPEVESITISGRGEPTLHPRFAAVAAEVLAYADRVQPRVPVRILTNGSRLCRPVVRRVLNDLDERIVKLDAARDRVNRPIADVTKSVAAISELRDTVIHACFVEGACSNCDSESVSSWVAQVGEIHPCALRICTIPPQAATRAMRPVSQARLREIARQVRSAAAVQADLLPWIPRSFPALNDRE